MADETTRRATHDALQRLLASMTARAERAEGEREQANTSRNEAHLGLHRLNLAYNKLQAERDRCRAALRDFRNAFLSGPYSGPETAEWWGSVIHRHGIDPATLEEG